MTPEILVGNAVADALAERGASVFPAVSDWVKMDQITWAVQQRIHATCILAAQAAPRSASTHPVCSLHAESENGNAPSWRTLHRTHLLLLAKGIIAVCAKTLPQRVVRWIGFETPSAQDHPALIHLCPCAYGIRC